MSENIRFDLKWAKIPPFPDRYSEILEQARCAIQGRMDFLILEMIKDGTEFILFEDMGKMIKIRNPIYELAELKAGKSREAELKRNIRDIAKENAKLKATLSTAQMLFDRSNHAACEKHKKLLHIGGMCGAVREPNDILRDIAKMCSEELE